MPMNATDNWLRSMCAAVLNTEPPPGLDLFGIQRLLQWKTIDDKRQGYGKYYGKSLDKILTEMGDRVGSVYARTGSATSVAAIPKSGEFQHKLKDWYKRLYYDVMKAFGEYAIEHVAPGIKSWDPFDDIVDEWTQKVTAERIDNISARSVKRIKAIIKNGVKNDSPLDDIADLLSNGFTFSSTRADLIARTEVVAAGNAGNHFGIQQKIGNSVALKKTWLSTADGRTRADHVAANGQVQDMDDPFTVGGDQLLFPGDPTLGAGADQLVNCRCTTTYSRA